MPFKRLSLITVLALGLTQVLAQTTASYPDLLRKATAGDVLSQRTLGVVYLEGLGTQKDYTQAEVWLRKAAEQGDIQSEDLLGKLYYDGQTLPRNLAQAAAWWRKAAEQGNADGQYNLALLYRGGEGVQQDYAQAAAWLRKAADQGHAEAQNNLGVCYQNGRGVPQDYTQAAAWYLKAAEQGQADAQNSLGVLYYTGQGVPKDLLQAAKWVHKAAEKGVAAAQKNLGLFYYSGQGVARNNAEAYFWLSIAATGFTGTEQEGVAKTRDAIAATLTPTELSETIDRAATWLAAHSKSQESASATGSSPASAARENAPVRGSSPALDQARGQVHELERQLAEKRASALPIPPKDMFETTADYEKRKQTAEIQRETQLLPLIGQIDALKRANYPDANVKPVFVMYDADAKLLTAEVASERFTFPVDNAEARQIHDAWADVTVGFPYTDSAAQSACPVLLWQDKTYSPATGLGSCGGNGSIDGSGLDSQISNQGGPGNVNGAGLGFGASTGGGLEQIGGRVSAPVVLHSVEAEFSDEARRAKYQGACLISLIVDVQGNPQNIRVARSLGKGLDEKAIEAVRQYKFRPAMKDGQTPVPVMITLEVDFRLY